MRAALLMLLCCAAGRVHGEDFRDPMRPAGTAPAPSRVAASALRLEGVIGGARPVAIVNGQVVQVGDTVAGAQILEITPQAVRYSRAGQIHSLELRAVDAVATVRVVRTPEARKP